MSKSSDPGKKHLASPISTGSGGSRFENLVQAVFTVAMLTRGLVPCLPHLPVIEICVQAAKEGYNLDDCVVIVSDGTQTARLLAQIKREIEISERSTVFGEVIRAALQDFRDSKNFTEGVDALALITGPLSSSDTENVRSILSWARTRNSAKKFFNDVSRANFSSDSKRKKLKAFRSHLKTANGGIELSDDEVWRFLKSFHLIGYDFDTRDSSTIPLLASLLNNYDVGDPLAFFHLIAAEVAEFNQDGGTITLETLSPIITKYFENATRAGSTALRGVTATHALQVIALSPDARSEAFVLASLLGSWNERVDGDKEVIKELVGDD